jgi:hypothetical protein
MSQTITISGPPAVRFSGPPADRMTGRAQARAARAAARAKPPGNYTPKKPQISAATVERANQFLDGEADIDQAIHQGIINSGMASHFRALMKADPTNTRAYLQSLGLRRAGEPQPQQVAAASDDYPTSGLSSVERGRIAAAREGRASAVVHGGL